MTTVYTNFFLIWLSDEKKISLPCLHNIFSENMFYNIYKYKIYHFEGKKISNKCIKHENYFIDGNRLYI